MTSSEHIAKVLKDLVKQVPAVKILYEYQKGIDTHVVEVKPGTTLNDHLFKAYEEKITFEFIQLFPTENIFFVTPDSYTRIQKVEQEFVGESFVDHVDNYIRYAILASALTAEVNTVSIDKDAIFSYVESLKSRKVTNDALVGSVATTLVDISLADILKGFSATERGFSESKIDSAGESNYAMAA